MERESLFIEGQWIAGRGELLESEDPSLETLLWSGACADSGQIASAARAADGAFDLWSGLEFDERKGFLARFVELLNRDKAPLAEAISKQVGKPLWESATEVNAMIGKLAPTVTASEQRNRETQRDQAGNGKVVSRFRPHGAVAIIGPYNFPGHMSNGHIMPALLAGNTVVLKPSEKAPLVAEMIVRLWQEAGIPRGVLNLLQGGGRVAEELIADPAIRGVFFTGSRAVGRAILQSVGTNKICAVEMGGNSPLIVWDSWNVQAAVVATIQSSFITSGQRCSAARRLIVPNGTFGDEFIRELVLAGSRLKIGRWNESPEPYMGPLRSLHMVNQVIEKQSSLREKGAVALLESRRSGKGSCFVTPGVMDVTNIERDDEEILGPFLQLTRVTTFEEAIDLANATRYGLAAGLISDSKELYAKFSRYVRAGIINWNQQLTGASPWAPFGGIQDSGNNRPSGYLASDYCVYATGSIELDHLVMPESLPPGLELQ